MSGFGSNRARGRERKKQGEESKKTSLPLLHILGKKKEKQCCLFCVFFFFLENA